MPNPVSQFDITIVVFQRTYTINTAPAWVRHKLQFFIDRNGSNNLDGGRINKVDRRSAWMLASRFGV